jgi:rRNA maturation endonuclease Nob1
MRKCWLCEKEWPDNAKFCPECGPEEPLGPTPEELRECRYATPSEECEHGNIGRCPTCMMENF